jgi:hypothetical protein
MTIKQIMQLSISVIIIAIPAPAIPPPTFKTSIKM